MSMSFEFDDFIVFSQRLLENKDSIIEDNNFQSIYRTIISRVYYSAFHHAKYWLEINYNYDKHLDKIAEDFEMFNQLNNLTPEKQ